MKLSSTPAAFQSEFKRLMRRYHHFDWAVAWASGMADTKECFYRGLRALMEMERQGKTRI